MELHFQVRHLGLFSVTSGGVKTVIPYGSPRMVFNAVRMTFIDITLLQTSFYLYLHCFIIPWQNMFVTITFYENIIPHSQHIAHTWERRHRTAFAFLRLAPLNGKVGWANNVVFVSTSHR